MARFFRLENSAEVLRTGAVALRCMCFASLFYVVIQGSFVGIVGTGRHADCSMIFAATFVSRLYSMAPIAYACVVESRGATTYSTRTNVVFEHMAGVALAAWAVLMWTLCFMEMSDMRLTRTVYDWDDDWNYTSYSNSTDDFDSDYNHTDWSDYLNRTRGLRNWSSPTESNDTMLRGCDMSEVVAGYGPLWTIFDSGYYMTAVGVGAIFFLMNCWRFWELLENLAELRRNGRRPSARVITSQTKRELVVPVEAVNPRNSRTVMRCVFCISTVLCVTKGIMLIVTFGFVPVLAPPFRFAVGSYIPELSYHICALFFCMPLVPTAIPPMSRPFGVLWQLFVGAWILYFGNMLTDYADLAFVTNPMMSNSNSTGEWIPILTKYWTSEYRNEAVGVSMYAEYGYFWLFVLQFGNFVRLVLWASFQVYSITVMGVLRKLVWHAKNIPQEQAV